MNNGGVANTASSLFGGLSFGAGMQKPNEPPKTSIFGTPSLFGSSVSANSQSPSSIGAQAQQQKSPFSNILKTATFNAGTTSQPTSLFGSSATPNTGGLFSSAATGAATNTNQGGLFNSFKTPQKTGFGSPTTFGASPGFGNAPTFGTSAFGAAPTFGATSKINIS